ncbi:MAG TPA: LysR family transcriptional regulator [Candidatus Gallimonas intestinigallinarum]|uniref:LysR family transcriptional regulator n=1 Tax=Candidatus Gallimonas intestinigallinarum TaxID=2838604 RepID=A0A9D2DXX2_9FIRM|nr:LysR family transcriptional regulator [Candidatus Gallimonas intestinigallinarum]
MVNLELYRVFYTVARCGSLTKAAEELYISQPAVSQAVKQLENQLGTSLFNRMHKGMELSKQGGELIYADVERALQLLSGVEDKLSELKQSATGTLRIGASETIFQYILADKIVAYNKQYPQVRIDLISDVSPKIIEFLKTDRCDVGFLNLPIEEDEGIRLSASVALLNDVFVAGEAFSELKGKELTVWDLQKYPLLMLEQNTIARAAIDHYAESLGVTLRPAVEVGSWDFMKRLVTDGMGIGCLPREYALRRLRDGELFELNVTPAMPSRSVGLALAKNANMPFSLRAFINLVTGGPHA